MTGMSNVHVARVAGGGDSRDDSGRSSEAAIRREDIMNTTGERLDRLERGRRRDRLVIAALAMGLPGLGLLAAAVVPSAPAVSDRLVTRSLVIVDEQNRPRIDLGTDAALGARVFLHDAEGQPLVGLSTGQDTGALTIFDARGRAVASLGASSTGDGRLRLTAPDGRAIVRLGRWTLPGPAQLWLESPTNVPPADE